MAKAVSAGFKTRLATPGTTLVWCCKLTLKDATVKGFTTADHDIEIDGVTYLTKRGFNPTSIAAKSGTATDNFEIEAYYDQVGITKADIINGKLQGARVDVFQVFWDDLTLGKITHLGNALVGDVKLQEYSFVDEVRGLTEFLEQSDIDVFTPECNVEEFCDARCGLSVATYTVTGTVTGVTEATNRRKFVDTSRVETTDVFRYGRITWTTGNNDGLTMEVKKFVPASDQVELFLAMPFPIQVGDQYSMVKGCDRKFATCKGFNNYVNFKGFPHIPGQAELMKMEYK